MGYTHYWREYKKPVEIAQWNDFCDCVRKLIDDSPVTLASWNGEPNTKPEVIKCTNNLDEPVVSFNGLSDDSYESFVLSFKITDFQFCKTQYRPYDLIVVAVLTLAYHTLGLKVSSDGDENEWLDGIVYLNRTLGASFTMPVFERD